MSARIGSGFDFSLAAIDQHAGVRDTFVDLWRTAPRIVAHDAKGMMAVLRDREILPRAEILRSIDDDTMVAAHLLNPSRSYVRLADAVADLLDRALPDEAAAWADAALQVAAAAGEQLAAREQTALYRDLELPIVTILAAIEAAGVAIDLEELRTLSVEIDTAVERLQEQVYLFAGERFNIGSPQQLGTILFEKLQLPAGQRNKTGWATGVEVLQSLARKHPIAAKVLEYREVSKLKNTYVDVIPRLVDPRDGRLRTVFNQTATATGRLSSTNPNLQNIPVRGELGRRIRRAFVAASADRTLLAADYSQIELRLMAHLSGDAAMRQAFAERQDIHDFTARQIFGVAPHDEVTFNQRRMAKIVNFGLLYGMSDFGLAQRLEISRTEAHEITDAYFARFPAVRAYIERTIEEGRELGYVSTILGRRRYIPDLRVRNYALRAAAEREATNAPLQGSAADLMKLAMVRIERRLRDARLDAMMLLQIHDELIFEVDRAVLHPVAELVRHEMVSALELSVPLEATLKSGPSWYDVASLDASGALVE